MMSPVHETITRSPEETMALGEHWAAEAKSGWVIGLSGDLGAGKTQLVKGLARGLGCRGKVTSPTFGLINEYSDGLLPLAHLDLYRLDTPEQIIGAGLEPYLVQPEGVSVVEWIERWRPDLGSRFEVGCSKSSNAADGWIRVVRIESINETERRIRHVDLGL